MFNTYIPRKPQSPPSRFSDVVCGGFCIYMLLRRLDMRIDQALLDRVKAVAKLLNSSVSTIVRLALVEFLDKHDKKSKE